MTLAVQSPDEVMIGNDAAWALTFHDDAGPMRSPRGALLEVSSADYGGEIRATLPGRLEPGAYSFVIEGLDDAGHAKLAAAAQRSPRPHARLHLFWRDANATVGGYLANVAGLGSVLGDEPPDGSLVAVLSVTGVSRRLGRVRYETHVEACERVWHRLATLPFDEPFAGAGFGDAVADLGHGADTTVTVYGAPAAPAADAPPDELPSELGRPSSDVMQEIADALELQTGKYGRGQLLIRDGELHVGPRQIPLSGAPRSLDHGSGVVEIQGGAAAGSSRRQFTLVLKGRPDLKPGDVVTFEPPPEEAAAGAVPSAPVSLGAAIGGELAAIATTLVGETAVAAVDPVDLYVSSVQHTLNRQKGFVTVLTGVTVTLPGGEWDSPPSVPVRRETARRDPAADSAQTAAQAIFGAAARAARERACTDIGEVRAMHVDGTGEPPGQTLRVWRGLERDDARAGAARRLSVRRDPPEELDGIPYLTPFAWGKCGLVVPRYPGTRVAMLHREGRPGDAIDAGALWASGLGPDSKPGDWWLTLPVGASDRQSVAKDKTPTEHTGSVTNDLIDADGNRVIEVGELTVRVTRDALGSAGDRPKRAKEGKAEREDSITIEHVDGDARIVIGADGKVLIETAADLTLHGANLKLNADQNVDITAENVNVSVDTAMTVS